MSPLNTRVLEFYSEIILSVPLFSSLIPFLGYYSARVIVVNVSLGILISKPMTVCL